MGGDPLSRTIRWLSQVVGLVMFGLLAGAVYRYLVVHANFNLHAVEKGVVYRSGQMPPDELARFVKSAGIRSVINLRGQNLGKDWYDAEMRCAHTLGVSVYDYPLNSREEVSVLKMKEISTMLHDAPKPVLIHCGAGSDRTGLVSALYCVDAGLPISCAYDQLSQYYGHFPFLFWNDSAAMDVSLKHYLTQVPPDTVNGTR
jgi:protein tyrosine phosphatase (PTP) superfamily phosphohydrolase (DUF442 family)